MGVAAAYGHHRSTVNFVVSARSVRRRCISASDNAHREGKPSGDVTRRATNVPWLSLVDVLHDASSCDVSLRGIRPRVE